MVQYRVSCHRAADLYIRRQCIKHCVELNMSLRTKKESEDSNLNICFCLDATVAKFQVPCQGG